MSRDKIILFSIMILVAFLLFVLPHITPNRFDEAFLMYWCKEDGLINDPDTKAKVYSVISLVKMDIILDILSKTVAAVSLLGLVYQFYREKNINEAQFVMNINHDFITNERIRDIYERLEKSINQEQSTNSSLKKKDIIDLANYLSFFEAFHGLIARNVVSYRSIDQLAYRFFLAANNRFVQDELLAKEGKGIAWKELYKLHYGWKRFREKKGTYMNMPSERDLSECPDYAEIVKRA